MSDSNTNNPSRLSSGPTPEMIEHFERRTREHIERVGRCLAVLAQVTPHRDELMSRALEHDASKFSDAECFGYIWLTEYHRCRHSGVPFTYPPGVEQQVDAAIAHHMYVNRHHPEHHADPNDMTDVDLMEMVCDWTAMAQEFGEPDGSARAWADKMIGRRLPLASHRWEFIYKTIALLEIHTPTAMRSVMPMASFLSTYSLVVEMLLLANLGLHWSGGGKLLPGIKLDVILGLIILFGVLRFAAGRRAKTNFISLNKSPLSTTQGIIVVVSMFAFVALQMWLFDAFNR